MEVEGSSKKMIATQAEMVEARVPLPYRDQCANHLIPLNKCRVEEFYLPWMFQLSITKIGCFKAAEERRRCLSTGWNGTSCEVCSPSFCSGA